MLAAFGRRPARPASAWRRSGSRPTARSPSATTSACPASTGCTRSATSTAACCSPTWGSTRAGSPRTRSSAARSSCARTAPRSPRVIFTDPQVGAVGLTLEGAQEAGLRVRHVDVETSGNAGGSFVGRGAAGDGQDRRRRGPARHRRRHDHRRRGRGGAARGDDRRHRRGVARRPLARRAVVPDAERALAEAARGVRPLTNGVRLT